MENKERNPSIDAPKDDIVIPGHVVKHDRTFKDKEEGEERMRGVHQKTWEERLQKMKIYEPELIYPMRIA